MKIDKTFITMVVMGAKMTRHEELGCDSCWEQVDRFAEMQLLGKDAAEAMPLVQMHLDMCGECREEFEALLTALKKEQRRRLITV